MTTEDISKLSPKEKRVKIAEECGWRITQISVNEPNDDVTITPPGEEVNPWRNVNQELPDYLNSLDDMHEAEKAINPCDWSSYTMSLRRIIQRDCEKPECYVPGTERYQLIADFWVYHATAEQRAEAFLITI